MVNFRQIAKNSGVPEKELTPFVRFYIERFNQEDPYYVKEWAERWNNPKLCKSVSDSQTKKILKKYGKNCD